MASCVYLQMVLIESTMLQKRKKLIHLKYSGLTKVWGQGGQLSYKSNLSRLRGTFSSKRAIFQAKGHFFYQEGTLSIQNALFPRKRALFRVKMNNFCPSSRVGTKWAIIRGKVGIAQCLPSFNVSLIPAWRDPNNKVTM